MEKKKLPSRMSMKERLQFFSKKLDSQGFLRSRVRIARIGIQYYDEYGNIARTALELIRSIPTFDNQIITFEHPDKSVTSDNVRDLQIGFISNIRYRSGWLEGLVTITDSEVIRLILKGDSLEFSCGYDGKLVKEPGVLNGESYDGLVTDIVGNHIALVREARAGAEATFIDTKDAKPIQEDIILGNVTLIDNNMPELDNQVVATTEELKEDAPIATDDSGVASTDTSIADAEANKVVEAGLELQVEELKTALNDSKDKLVALQTKFDVLSAQKDAMTIKLQDSKVDLTGAEIAARVEAWTVVKANLKDSVTPDYGLTVSEVRKLWLTQELPALASKIQTESEAYISGLWDVVAQKLTAPQPEAVAIPIPVQDSVDDKLISVLDSPLNDSVSTLEAARQAYVARIAANRG